MKMLATMFLGILLTAISLNHSSASPSCQSFTEARKVEPAAYLVYSRYLDGHRGEKCWFVGTREEVVHSERTNTKRLRKIAETRPLSATGAVPLPRPLPKSWIDDQRITDMLMAAIRAENRDVIMLRQRGMQLLGETRE